MSSFITYLHRVRFSRSEQVHLAKRLSFLLEAGLPLAESMRLVRDQTHPRRQRTTYADILHRLEEGQYLATALGRYPQLFGTLGTELIRVGEESGRLGENLAYIAEALHSRHLLERKVAGALAYPAIIAVATLGMTAGLTTFIFPKLLPIFSSLNAPLPLLTRLLIAASSLLRDFGLPTLFFIFGAVAAFMTLRKRFSNIRFWSDRVLLRLPLIGTLVRQYSLALAYRTVGLLLVSGIPLSQALESASRTLSSAPYRHALAVASESVQNGRSLSQSLENESLFPDFSLHLIEVGETTGKLSESLLYLAAHFEGEVDMLTKRLSSALEPALMIVMGLMVGAVAISIIMPIYTVTQGMTPR